MHRTRRTNAGQQKKLDLRKETLRRLDTLSEEALRRVAGGRGSRTDLPSVDPTGEGTCG